MKLKFNTSEFKQIGLGLFLLTTILTGFSSCKKFLDTPRNSGLSLITTVKDCQGILDASSVYTNSPKDGQTSSDDYFFSAGDFVAQDEVTRKLYSWEADAQRITGGDDWQTAYGIVSQVNIALEALDKIAEKNPALKTSNDFKAAMGHGLFIRSNYFYQIAVQYSKTYTAGSANQDMGIPIRLTADINMVSSRGTVQETYDRIIKDLKDALVLLPGTTAVPARPGKAAVYALLARIYLAMEDYTAAGVAANSALQIKSDLLTYDDLDEDIETPFKRFNKEVIYHSTMYALGLNEIRVNADVIAAYTDPNDLRKVLFFTENGSPDQGTYYFKGSYNEDLYTYFNGLATDEIYLIRAECYARAGNTTAAMADLNTLLRSRWKSGSYVNLVINNKDVALAKILLERRKELIMRGQRWGDLKRLNKTTATAQTISRSGNSVTYQLPPNDLRYQLLLPQNVIEYGKLPQNPRQ